MYKYDLKELQKEGGEYGLTIYQTKFIVDLIKRFINKDEEEDS